ncbi:hypothetical protein PRIPAC_88708 [Pristionchus pacificus]|uniref:Uncharacterized protein n=1 Tax=Pristionchus pacificus TaxID=54126 RepID=A0A2A6B9C3_PRIPA|nr:hypothetical protein PRIPAC_88708 [Pristionchus pacificus]|eukprot:PDM62480.1 hypothetical protein PRIPAC_51922 [Pristionchus pacificus]
MLSGDATESDRARVQREYNESKNLDIHPLPLPRPSRLELEIRVAVSSFHTLSRLSDRRRHPNHRQLHARGAPLPSFAPPLPSNAIRLTQADPMRNRAMSLTTNTKFGPTVPRLSIDVNSLGRQRRKFT